MAENADNTQRLQVGELKRILAIELNDDWESGLLLFRIGVPIIPHSFFGAKVDNATFAVF